MLGKAPEPHNLSVLIESSWEPEIASFEVSSKDIEEAIRSKLQDNNEDLGGVSISVDVKKAAFEVPAEGVVKAWVTWGDEKLLAGGVRFKKG